MKVTEIVLVALLFAGSLAAPMGAYGSTNDAFKETFMHFEDLSSLGASPKIIDTTTLMFTVAYDELAERLIFEGVHHSLADLLVAATNNDLKDTFIRKTGIQTFKIEENAIQMVACVYRTAAQNKLDFVCLAAQSKVTLANTLAVIGAMKIKLMKRLATHFSRFRSLHAFSASGFNQMRGLGSAETQNKLTDFLEESQKGKAAAYTALYEKKDDPYTVKLYKNGLTSFSQSASVESLEGVESNMFNEYFEHLTNQLAIPADTKPDFLIEMQLATMGSRGEWKSIDFIFKNSKGTAKYINVMCATDSRSGEADFLIADVQASFELGPDIIVTTSTSKALFGLISWTTVKIVKRAAEISEETIQILFNFFKLAAFEKFIAFRRGVVGK